MSGVWTLATWVTGEYFIHYTMPYWPISFLVLIYFLLIVPIDGSGNILPTCYSSAILDGHDEVEAWRYLLGKIPVIHSSRISASRSRLRLNTKIKNQFQFNVSWHYNFCSRELEELLFVLRHCSILPSIILEHCNQQCLNTIFYFMPVGISTFAQESWKKQKPGAQTTHPSWRTKVFIRQTFQTFSPLSYKF